MRFLIRIKKVVILIVFWVFVVGVGIFDVYFWIVGRGFGLGGRMRVFMGGWKGRRG